MTATKAALVLKQIRELAAGENLGRLADPELLDRFTRRRDPAAFEALLRIDHDGAYANLVLPPMLDHSELSSRDRHFVTELVYGTTRMRRACDALVDRFVLTEPEPEAQTLLRLGAYQLVFAAVAPHAARSPRDRRGERRLRIAPDSLGPGPMIPSVVQRVTSPVFIGREVEVDQLGEVIGRASAGIPSTVLVGGEAGIGKTRLLGELSSRMMVSNGNVTGLAERLVEQGLLDRRASQTDRRAQIVSLTAEGRRVFRTMARTHEDWIAEIFAGLSAEETDALMYLLAKTKGSARKAVTERGAT